MNALLPRLKPDKGDTPRFRKLYAMDCAADDDNPGLIVPVVHGYTNAFFDGDAKAGTNLLRILFIVGVHTRDRGETLPQSMQDKVWTFQEMLVEQMPSSAAYYEALASFFDPESGEHGGDAMFLLAMDGNELAREFIANYISQPDTE